MSDDDLWRPKDTGEPTGGAADPATPAEGSGPGAVPPPHNPYGVPPGYQRPYPPPPDPSPPASAYGAPQGPYGAPYGPAYRAGVLPDHPSATTAMVLGIIGLAGLVVCGGLTLVLSPAAWIVGAKAVREIDASPGRYGGRDRAQGGKIMGIIGTVILALGILAIIAIVVLAIAVGGSNDPTPVFPSPSFRAG